MIRYKTGAMPGDVSPAQLAFYAILVQASTERRVSGASFWYLDDASTWTMEFTGQDKALARAGLLAVVREMEQAHTFPSTIAPHCASRPFLHVCDVGDDIEIRRARKGG
jgi:hypothetical protein